MKKWNGGKCMSRTISRSQMTGMNLIKIRKALISVKVPLEALPTKWKFSNDNNGNDNNND